MTDLNGKGSNQRWYPISIYQITKYLKNYEVQTELCDNYNHLIANISYNIQYLEYLRKTLNELNLTEVLQIQTIKNFIIISTSIIEGILYLICCKEKLRKRIKLKEVKASTSTIVIENMTIITHYKVYIENDKEEYENLNFVQMIRRVEKRKILNIDIQFFQDLNHLRKLRNKIHLQENKNINTTDYKTFWIPEYKLSKLNLILLLDSDIFKGKNNNIELFNFLKN